MSAIDAEAFVFKKLANIRNKVAVTSHCLYPSTVSNSGTGTYINVPVKQSQNLKC